jgi:hypothetical protein
MLHVKASNQNYFSSSDETRVNAGGGRRKLRLLNQLHGRWYLMVVSVSQIGKEQIL